MDLTIILILLVVANGFWLLLNLLGLPGNWLIVAGTLLVAWWKWDAGPFSVATLIAIVGLAGLAELLEFVMGVAGAAGSGGTRRGAMGALIGGLVGGLLGIGIPIPFLGPLMGACLGAGIGAIALESSAGKSKDALVQIGVGAGVGRFLGTIIKIGIGGIICVIVLIAAIVA